MEQRLAYVAKRDILAGEVLLADYGNKYWSNWSLVSRRLHEDKAFFWKTRKPTLSLSLCRSEQNSSQMRDFVDQLDDLFAPRHRVVDGTSRESRVLRWVRRAVQRESGVLWNLATCRYTGDELKSPRERELSISLQRPQELPPRGSCLLQ